MNLTRSVEALLFVSDSPVTAKALAAALEATEAEIEQALRDLEEHMFGSSLQVVRIAGGYQLSTKPDFGELIARFLKPQRQKLSRSLMEVLAIIAYKQPMTMAEIDAIRGVQSDYSVKALLERRLIQEVGRRQAPGRPLLYGTSQQFLHQFNLHDLTQLPSLPETNDLLPATVEPDGGVSEEQRGNQEDEGESIVVR